MITPKGEIITGYKATDKDMKCRGFQFELGQWYEHDGEISLCESGFHFCKYPSGPWCYYPEGRLFQCEAEEVLISTGPGADIKHVARRIRLVEEISITGDGNTGDVNTGDRNTGDGNTGNWNTGNWNTGNWNTGDGNTGDRNMGDGNTGDRNTGNWNTGNWNTGDGNTGDGNTGDGNAGSNHSGSLNWGDGQFMIFNKPANRNEVDFGLVWSLSNLLQQDDPIDPKQFLSLPNATPEAIKELHAAHIAARKNKQ